MRVMTCSVTHLICLPCPPPPASDLLPLLLPPPPPLLLLLQRAVFDPLPLAAQEAYLTLLPALLAAATSLFAPARR
jgi:hypothetical protein